MTPERFSGSDNEEFISYVINNVPSLRFVYGRFGNCKLQLIYVTSAAVSVYFDDADNATCKPRLVCRIPWCRSHSRLFSALVVNVQAHENMRAIKPCNTNLYCIVVKSWHCELHRKLAINSNIKR